MLRLTLSTLSYRGYGFRGAFTALTWLWEPPQNNVTLSGLLRRELAGLRQRGPVAKAARTWRHAAGRARDFFLGSMAGFIYYGGLPLGSLGMVSGLTDGLELAAIVKVIAILSGWVVQFSLRIAAYVIGGERMVARGGPIDLERYGNRSYPIAAMLVESTATNFIVPV